MEMKCTKKLDVTVLKQQQTVVFRVFVDSNVEKRGAQPLKRHGDVSDRSKDNLGVQMFYQMLMQAINVSVST